MIIQGLFITALLVFFNGFFVAAEFALVKVRGTQLDIRIQEGSRSAKLGKHIIGNLDAYLSACQLGITLASLGLGWVGEEVISDIVIQLFTAFGVPADSTLGHSVAIPTAFILITVMHIVIGEQAPKTLAIRYAETTTLICAIPLTVLYTIFRPFIATLNWMSTSLVTLLGMQPVDGHDIHSEEELRVLLEQSHEGGGIASSEHELIEKVFHFDDRVVNQIMVPRTRMSLLDVNLPSEEILDLLFREGYTRIPVYQDMRDNIIGIVHSKDLFRMARQNKGINIRDALRPAYFVPETKRIADLLREFQKNKMHLAIVVDEFGAASGIVTLEDIIEELVGEIQDEHDEETPPVERRSADEFVVKAYAPIIDVNKLLPNPLPEGNDYATVAGLVNIIFGQIPEVNKRKEFSGYEFTILRTSKRSVELVLLKLLEIEEERDEDDDGGT